MNKFLACSALLATALAGVAATGGLALAEENGKLYPAFGCIETGTGGGSTINRSEFRITKSSGGVDDTATILCPIIRDERTTNFLVEGIKTAVVHVFDTILNKDVSCSLIARHHSGNSIFFQTQSTSGVNSAGQDLVFENLHTGNVEGGNDAYYYIQCKVPTNQAPQVVKIFSYEVTER